MDADFPDDDDFLASLPDEYFQDCEKKDGSLKECTVDLPSSFPFPFEPYDIQVDLMKKLYEALELGKIGIFESPTGTGKSLSLICGSLTWLKHFEERKQKELENSCDLKKSLASDVKTEELDWVAAHSKKLELEERMNQLKEESERRNKIVDRLDHIRGRAAKIAALKRKRAVLDEEFNSLFKDSSSEINKSSSSKTASGSVKKSNENENKDDDADDEDDIVVAEYNSDNDDVKNLLESDEDDDAVSLTEEHVTKIFYCSRTHSQLSQFVSELQRSPYGEDTRAVCLGSRMNLCINEQVTRLKSLSLMNDRCLELQKSKNGKKKNEEHQSKKRKCGGCPYYRTEAMNHFSEEVLVEVRDVEDLVSLGRQIKACPYYGSRYAVPSSQILIHLRCNLSVSLNQSINQGLTSISSSKNDVRDVILNDSTVINLVVLPYNTLLHKSTRESSSIRLKGNIVIIDEGHNLMETISNIHSIEVTDKQLTVAHSQLSRYLERYRSRLKAKNLMYIKQILFLLSAILRLLDDKSLSTEENKKSRPASAETTCQLIECGNALKLGRYRNLQIDFLNVFTADVEKTRLDNINLYKVLKYCRKSMIAKKLLGFAEKFGNESVTKKAETKEKSDSSKSQLSNFLKEISEPKLKTEQSAEEVKATEVKKEETFSSPLMHIEGFLDSLTTADKDGRIVINKTDELSRSSVKFLLLNPGSQFCDVVKEARAVIIAGGTMQPISDFKDQLLFSTGASQDRILEFSCGHVIPSDQILPIALSQGPTGVELDFTYESRSSHKMMDELGRVVLNLCSSIYGGVVVFFPSYEYEKIITERWCEIGLLDKIAAKKQIFREPKQSNQVDALLQEYSACIMRLMNRVESEQKQNDGALLLSVVGGKMSEGINFSGHLGRCIVMVGLPYPNIHSPELKEKMDYLNANMPRGADGRTAGQIHFENLCMKAVNQSIGRAIRHRKDYASILLLDYRYKRKNVVSKLPSWINNHLQVFDKFGPAYSALNKFSQTRRKLNE